MRTAFLKTIAAALFLFTGLNASTVPAAFLSFVNSTLFSLEKAVRSSVVPGLVGAGGIGIKL